MLVSAVRTLPGTHSKYSAIFSTRRIGQGCLGSIIVYSLIFSLPFEGAPDQLELARLEQKRGDGFRNHPTYTLRDKARRFPDLDSLIYGYRDLPCRPPGGAEPEAGGEAGGGWPRHWGGAAPGGP